MAILEIRVSKLVCVELIVLGLPASAAVLSIGVPHLIGGSWADFAPALVLCGLGVFLLLMMMAIAAFRRFLHRKKR